LRCYVVHEGFDAGAIGLLLGGEADTLAGFRCCEGAEGLDVAPVERGFGAELVGEEVALFGRDPGEGCDVVGHAFLSGGAIDHHRLAEARVGG